jgi:MOSC domain-containing protein YiiM
MAELEKGLAQLAPPRDLGELGLIVSRCDNGVRETPERVILTPAGGVPGDAWLRDAPDKIDAQIAMMRVDVARLIANGQPLTLPGDNLLVDLDLSAENLPPGTRLELGEAILEVTPEPHNGCLKFRQRFGKDALQLTAQPTHRQLRLRGIYVKVVESGEVAVGGPIRVLSRV